MDIEGHEMIVLRQLHEQARLPRLLTFEHLHLSTEEKAEARTLLATLGYREIGWHKDGAAFVLNRGPTIT